MSSTEVGDMSPTCVAKYVADLCRKCEQRVTVINYDCEEMGKLIQNYYVNKYRTSSVSATHFYVLSHV